MERSAGYRFQSSGLLGGGEQPPALAVEGLDGLLNHIQGVLLRKSGVHWAGSGTSAVITARRAIALLDVPGESP